MSLTVSVVLTVAMFMFYILTRYMHLEAKIAVLEIVDIKSYECIIKLKLSFIFKTGI